MSRDEYFSFRGSFVSLNLQHVPCNIPDSHSSLHLPDFGRVKKTNYPTAPFRKLQERGLGGRSFARAPTTRLILDIDKAEQGETPTSAEEGYCNSNMRYIKNSFPILRNGDIEGSVPQVVVSET